MNDKLTPREKEAARIAAAGHSNKDVAKQMEIGEATVEQYLHRAYSKLGVESRTGLRFRAESLK